MSLTRPAPWLPADTPPHVRGIVQYALLDIGISETPPGSNRGPEIDEYMRECGLDPEARAPWCGAAAAHWFRKGGAALPPLPAWTQSWHQWAYGAGLWQPTPSYGAATVYGQHGQAEHIGVVVRLPDDCGHLYTVEGNTALDPHGNQREGIAVDLKDRTGSPWILGYVLPRKVGP